MMVDTNDRSEAAIAMKPRGGPVLVESGEWTGWGQWEGDPFENHAGPFYERIDENGNVLAFRTGPQHMNGAGFMHGGCLMTFADAALFTIARSALTGGAGVTVHLAGDFLAAVTSRAYVEARGSIMKVTGSMVFISGLVTADGASALSFSGIIRRIRESRP